MRTAFRLLVALLCVGTLSPLRLCAQTNAAKASVLSSNRYLFIVDTSRAMKSRADGVVKTVQDLLTSGLGGQLRRGDSLGLWTFNDELYAGRFPLQDWSPAAHRAIGIRILSFLKDQKYEKRARLDQVLPMVSRVIKASDAITVFLISDGVEKVRGTPFDEQINQVYKLWENDQAKAGLPFVTALRASRGKILAYSVTPAPWPVEMPALPADLQVAQPAPKPPPTNAPKAQPPAVPPLILSGKKLSLEKIEAAQTPAAPVKVEELKPLAEVPKSDQVAKLPENAASGAGSTSAPASSLVVRARSEAANGPPPAPPPALAPAKPETTLTTVPATGRPRPEPVASALNGPASETARVPRPIVVETHEASSLPPATPPPAETPPTARSSTLPPVVQIAEAVPAEPFLSQWTIWVAGLVLVGTTAAVVFMVLRRTRAMQPLSLITRSLDQDKR